MIGDRVFPQEAREWTRRSIEEIILSLTPKRLKTDLRITDISTYCLWIDKNDNVHLFPLGQLQSLKYHPFKLNAKTINGHYLPIMILDVGQFTLNGVTYDLWGDIYDKLVLPTHFKIERKNVTFKYTYYGSATYQDIVENWTKECVIISYDIDYMTEHHFPDNPVDDYWTIDSYPDVEFDRYVHIPGISPDLNTDLIMNITKDVKVIDNLHEVVYDFTLDCNSKAKFGNDLQATLLNYANPLKLTSNSPMTMPMGYYNFYTVNGGYYTYGHQAESPPDYPWDRAYINHEGMSIGGGNYANLRKISNSDFSIDRDVIHDYVRQSWFDLLYVSFERSGTGSIGDAWSKVGFNGYNASAQDYSNIVVNTPDWVRS